MAGVPSTPLMDLAEAKKILDPKLLDLESEFQKLARCGEVDSGAIQRKDYIDHFKKLGFHGKVLYQFQRLFSVADYKGDNKLDWDEYLVLMAIVLTPGNTREKCTLTFRMHDEHSKGYLVRSDLSKMTESQSVAAFQRQRNTMKHMGSEFRDMLKATERATVDALPTTVDIQFSKLDPQGTGKIYLEKWIAEASSTNEMVTTMWLEELAPGGEGCPDAEKVVQALANVSPCPNQ